MQVVVRGEAGSDAPPAAERELERLPDALPVERVGDRAPGASARQKRQALGPLQVAAALAHRRQRLGAPGS